MASRRQPGPNAHRKRTSLVRTFREPSWKGQRSKCLLERYRRRERPCVEAGQRWPLR